MVKEFFGLSLKETFATYTLLSSAASIVGIILILLMDASVLLAGVAIIAILALAIIIHMFEETRKKKNTVKHIGA